MNKGIAPGYSYFIHNISLICDKSPFLYNPSRKGGEKSRRTQRADTQVKRKVVEMMKNIVLIVFLTTGVWTSALTEAGAETEVPRAVMESSANAMVRPGKQIRQADVMGYTLTYYLMDSSENHKMMDMMESRSALGMKKNSGMTHHLMVYIQTPDGSIVPGDVAYVLTDPDGQEFRTMTMGMYGGYGADISMKGKGEYRIGTKIIIERGELVRLFDQFTFEVK
jgi:hypothetical protein